MSGGLYISTEFMNILIPFYGFTLFFMGFRGFFISRNFLLLMLSFELMFLSLCILACYFSYVTLSVDGLILSIFILGLAAVESALGLSIYVALYKNLKT